MGKIGNVGISRYLVLQIIAENEPEGISVGKLAEEIHCHRETSGLYCMQLKSERLVYRRGKIGKYHLTDRARGYPALLAYSLGNAGLNQMLDWNMICLHSTFCNDKLLNQYIRKFRDKNSTGVNLKYLYGDENITKLVLFEFANRLGALIMYFLIYALKPNKAVSYASFKAADLEVKNNDDIALRWINNAVTPGRILDEFTRIALVTGMIMYNERKEPENRYVVDIANWNELMRSFSRLYPEIFHDLEEIQKESLKNIDIYDMKGKLIKK